MRVFTFVVYLSLFFLWTNVDSGDLNFLANILDKFRLFFIEKNFLLLFVSRFFSAMLNAKKSACHDRDSSISYLFADGWQNDEYLLSNTDRSINLIRTSNKTDKNSKHGSRKWSSKIESILYQFNQWSRFRF